MNAREQERVTQSISELQLKGDAFTKQTILEQRRVNTLEQELRDVEHRIADQRLNVKAQAVDVLNLHRTTANPAHQRADGLDPTKQADLNQRKLVSNLESRLNKLLIRQSEIAHGNAALREQINHLRKTRMTAEAVKAQYVANAAELKAEMAASMEQVCA
ncbi:unnamed protein product, partial [Phaeothamnion confervicola]